MSYDKKCMDLAEFFLEDTPERLHGPRQRQELAQQIQDTIEGYLESLPPREPPKLYITGQEPRS